MLDCQFSKPATIAEGEEGEEEKAALREESYEDEDATDEDDEEIMPVPARLTAQTATRCMARRPAARAA